MIYRFSWVRSFKSFNNIIKKKVILKSNLFIKYITVLGALGLVSYGINTTWTSPFLPYLTSNSSIIPITNEEGSWLVTAPLIGRMFGAIAGGLVADKFGRKWSILYMAPVVMTCCIAIAYIRNIWYLCLLRSLIGIADGASYTIVPMYIGEISSPEIRGFLSSFLSLSFIIGTLIINIIGSFWDIYTCSMISALIPAVHFLIFIFMPESPYWYLKVNRYERAEKAFKIFRGTSEISKKFEIMKTSVEEDKAATKSSFKELFTVRSNRKASLICLLVTCLQRATAKAPLIFYTKTIFEQTGSTISSTVSSISFCFVELIVAAISAYFIIDKFGKKKLTVISVIGSIIALLTIGSYFLLKDFNSSLINSLNYLPITSLVTYNIFNSIAISFVPFCYASELFPTSVKSNALTLVELTMVFTGMITAKIFQTTGDYFGSLTIPFFGFSAFSVLFLILVIKIVPETKGYTLEEIQLFLKGNKVVRL